MRLVTGLLTLFTLPGAAAALDLSLPVACTLGDTCYIQQGFDHDTGPGTRDFACGTLTYDGHDGTDFALPTIAAMEQGVDVLAAAPGTVRGIRDEMPDIAQGTPGAPDVTNRECGNGIAITHDDGWETQYCHMKLGSIRVQAGDTVQAGTPLGQIGLSGQTEFPHLHLTVRRNGTELDPFQPSDTATCGATGDDLWSPDIAMPPGGATVAGWATQVPDYDAVRAGTADEPITRDSALVLYGLFFGGRAGDQVTITVDGPQGRVVDHAEPVDRPQAIFFRAAGLRAPDGGWPTGDYSGTVTLHRNGATIDSLTIPLTIPLTIN